MSRRRVGGWGKPKLLFEKKYQTGYDIAQDGNRFLMIKAANADQTPADQLHIVVNWFEELRRRVPIGK